jgi:hypothetical protein
MTIQISAVAAQCEHEQQLGVHSWRRHLSGRQALNRGVEDVAEAHTAISSQ